MNTYLSERYLVPVLFLALFVMLFILGYLSEGSFGGADSYVHFRISRYAFKYPELFLDHWGKPLFTILSSPFSQFGYSGIKVFNILAGLLTAFYSYKIAIELKLRNAYLVIFFVSFTPIYLIIHLTGLTEILFSLVLVLSVYLLIKERHIAAAIMLSLLPFARAEGLILLPIFMLAFLLDRKLRALPYMFVGFVVFGFLGWIVLGDFLWYINRFPYTGASSIYGSGDLSFFLMSYEKAVGKSLGSLFVLGGVFALYEFVINRGVNKSKTFYAVLFLLCLPLLYLALHSVLWWKGIGGSLGLLRVLAGVSPLAAILSLKGINLILDKIEPYRLIKYSAIIIVLVYVIKTPFNIYTLPWQWGQPEKLVKEAGLWLQNTGHANEMIYYYDPFFCHVLELDPFDKSVVQEKLSNIEHPEEGVAKNSIVLWDAHFGPNEGRMPLGRLLANPNFELLIKFVPETPLQVLGGYDYEIYVFQKIN